MPMYHCNLTAVNHYLGDHSNHGKVKTTFTDKHKHCYHGHWTMSLNTLVLPWVEHFSLVLVMICLVVYMNKTILFYIISGDQVKTERELPPLMLGKEFTCTNFAYTHQYFHLHGGMFIMLFKSSFISNLWLYHKYVCISQLHVF